MIYIFIIDSIGKTIKRVKLKTLRRILIFYSSTVLNFESLIGRIAFVMQLLFCYFVKPYIEPDSDSVPFSVSAASSLSSSITAT